MEDKDVGEIWREHLTHENWACPERKLIRKLVEERARYIALEQHQPGMLFVLDALRHFGIDPETFK